MRPKKNVIPKEKLIETIVTKGMLITEARPFIAQAQGIKPLSFILKNSRARGKGIPITNPKGKRKRKDTKYLKKGPKLRKRSML